MLNSASSPGFSCLCLLVAPSLPNHWSWKAQHKFGGRITYTRTLLPDLTCVWTLPEYSLLDLGKLLNLCPPLQHGDENSNYFRGLLCGLNTNTCQTLKTAWYVLSAIYLLALTSILSTLFPNCHSGSFPLLFWLKISFPPSLWLDYCICLLIGIWCLFT